LKFYFKNIPNLGFKFISPKSLTNVQISIFEKVQKPSFKFEFHLKPSISASKNSELFFLFLFGFRPSPQRHRSSLPLFHQQQPTHLSFVAQQARQPFFLLPTLAAGHLPPPSTF
jgi:hypothetical protein